MNTPSACPLCRRAVAADVLAQAHWYPHWTRPDGACPACVQHHLLVTLLAQGDSALHEAVQAAWPLDAEAAFGALPTPLRLHADPRFHGNGVTLALVDAAFYPHPDLVQPVNRIRAWVDATVEPVVVRRFTASEAPQWPDWDGARGWQWHGTMTSVTAAGNGFLSHGLYSGLACEAGVLLVQVRDARGHISSQSIARALHWIREHAQEFGVRVVSLSVSGDEPIPGHTDPVDGAVAQLVHAGVCVVAASGNDGVRQLLPPATAPGALTIGGLDDHNDFSDADVSLWHSNYGEAAEGVFKPELVAPSIWVVAPLLPGTGAAAEAAALFAQPLPHDDPWRDAIAERKWVTPHYQLVEGTSFAAPLVASAIACMLEANPKLTPTLIRDILLSTAQPVAGASRERQGAGALQAGAAVAQALAEAHEKAADWRSPAFDANGVCFTLHDHAASSVQVLGSWNQWNAGCEPAQPLEAGLFRSAPLALAKGRYEYKFLLDGTRWLDDPANPRKSPDGNGGFNSVCVVP